ncbi:MAG: MFS transporter [Thermodesulfobacteriota bacterium]
MAYDQETLRRIREGRKSFIAMAATYFLGVFNDNFFKQAGLLLAVAAGQSQLQGTATWLFSLPFVLFSAYGGWVADRFAKKRVVILVKFLELIAMMMGAYGILTLDWNWILAMVFLMGFQSTFFTPALNGSIPELYPAVYVTKANALLKLVTTAAILLGMAGAGFALDQQWIATDIEFGRWLVVVVVLFVSVTGVLASFWVHYRPAPGKRPPFPWSGPFESIRETYRIRRDPQLFLAICGDVFFYFLSLLAVLVINKLGIDQLGYSKTVTSILSVSLMVGVCAGALIASKITSSDKWNHVLAPAAFGMGGCLVISGLVTASAVDSKLLLLLLVFVGTGICGGIFLIPLTAFIQVRPNADVKGRTIAAANFCGFSGMLVAGPIFSLLDRTFLPSSSMIILGCFGIIGAGVFYMVVRKVSDS